MVSQVNALRERRGIREKIASVESYRVYGVYRVPATQKNSHSRKGVGQLSVQCGFIKPSGERCRGTAKGQQGLCWAHDPANSERRRIVASRGGRGKSTKEVSALKGEIKTVIADVRAGDLDRNDAAVMIQGYRTLKDFIAMERQVRETDELAAEIEHLKREYGAA
jgi:hypothetical protein